jgi:hypothetical protein
VAWVPERVWVENPDNDGNGIDASANVIDWIGDDFADNGIWALEETGYEAKRLVRLQLQQAGETISDYLSLGITRQHFGAQNGLRRERFCTGNGAGGPAAGVWLRVMEKRNQLDQCPRVRGAYQTHGAGAAQIDRRIDGPAPHQLRLAIADPGDVEVAFLAVQRNQGAGDGTLGGAARVLLGRILQQTAVSPDQVRLQIVQQAFPAKLRRPRDQQVMPVRQGLAGGVSRSNPIALPAPLEVLLDSLANIRSLTCHAGAR